MAPPMIAMTMKAEALFARVPEAENAQGKDRGEHDGHEEVAQEHAHHRQPAQLEEDQEADQHIQHAIQAQDLVGGEFSQQASAGEPARQEADEAQGGQKARRPVAEAQDAVLEGKFLGIGIREEQPVEPTPVLPFGSCDSSCRVLSCKLMPLNRFIVERRFFSWRCACLA